MSTTTLYETTPQTGTVSSTNLTSLYSNTGNFTAGVVNSSVYSVNGGLGVTVNPTTGNVLVSIGQAVAPTDNVQFVNIKATGNLSNNYFTLVNALGSNGQVLTTNGAGVTTWANAPGSVIPNGTTRGQVLYWDGSAWTADSTISTSSATNRLTSVYENNAADVNSALFVRKDYTTSTYTTGDGVGIGLQLDSNSQATNSIGLISAEWDPTAPTLRLSTNINNNTAGPFLSAAAFTTAQATLPGDLSIDGQVLSVNADSTAADSYIGLKGTSVQIKYNNTTNFIEMPRTSINNITLDTNTISTVSGDLILDSATNKVGINNPSPAYTLDVTGDAYINANLTVHGSTLLGNNYISDLTHVVGEFQVANNSITNLFVNHSTGYVGINTGSPAFLLDVNGDARVGGTLTANEVIGLSLIATNGNNIYFNNDDVGAADSFLTVKRGASADVSVKWNQATTRWQTTVDGTNYLNIPNQNLDTTDDVAFSSVAVDGRASIDTTTITTTSTSPAVLITSTRNVMTVLVYIVQGANVHCVNATVLKTGATTAMLTTYGEMYNNISLASFAADVSGANLRLAVQATSATSTVFSAVRTSLT